MGITYRDSGVDIDGGNRFVKRIGDIVKSTFNERVITDIGGFGALFSGSFPEMKDPVLVSGTDGVGTKLQVARMMNRHDTIGIDAVAMCVNDIVVSGARPMFFLDYIACGKLREDVMVDVVRGLAKGCRQAGCSLIGGETAEHPDVMDPDDYDIAGFSVGVVDRAAIINGSEIKPGDVIIGLPSSGVHSNGFSMVRKILFNVKKYTVDTKVDDLGGALGPVLLEPTKIYVQAVLSCLDNGVVPRGIVHITGGGFYENVPRILPKTCAAAIKRSSFNTPAIFNLLQKEGEVEEEEMFTTFNMGIGLMMVFTSEDADAALDTLSKYGESPVIIGEITSLKKDRVVMV